MQPDTEQLMKKLHTSLCPDKLEAEIRDKFLELEENYLQLLKERDVYITVIAECRDVFPTPKIMTTLDSYYVEAMADPLAVPEYVRMCAAINNKG